MRRRRPSRLLALPLSLWFVALTTDTGHIDACPMHHAMMTDHAAGGRGHGAMEPVASMVPLERLEQPAQGDSPADESGPVQCRCIGTCCGGSSLTLPALASALLPSSEVPHQGVATARAAAPLGSAGSCRQPPSIGPPLLHAA